MAKKVYKYIFIILIMISNLLLLSNKTFAYDINNPKSPSLRSYNLTDLVTLVDGSTWRVVQACTADQGGILLFGTENVNTYGTMTWNDAITTYPNIYKNDLSNRLTQNGGNPTGLITASIDAATINAVLADYPSAINWIVSSNYWSSTEADAANAFAINSMGWVSFTKNSAIYFGYRPYIMVRKSNIRGNYSVSTTATSNGSISALAELNNKYYEKDEKITVTVSPNTGYRLKAGTLKYNNSTVIGKDNANNYAYLGPAANTTVSGEFEPIQYSITYNDPQSATNNNPTSYTIETNTITLQDLSKEGYTFGGWYDSDSYQNKVTQITKGSTGNKTLWAKWSKNESEPTYLVTIPTNVNTMERTGIFTITSSNVSNLNGGSVNVGVTYPNNGFELKTTAGDVRKMTLYIGESAVEQNKITASNNIVARFTDNNSQAIYYSIESGKYSGVYSGKITFTVSYVEGG